jgi:hypothetical protein
MKRFTVSLSIVILFIAAAFSSAARIHYISYGDTLWDLSIRYYHTPFHWEDILSANPTLEGVEYLMPGNELLIPDIYGIDAGSQDIASIGSFTYTTSGSSSLPVLSRLVLETAGMITSDPIDPSGYIIETDAEDEDIFIDLAAYPGDLVAVDIGQNQGIEVDRVYRIYNVGEEIRHPQTGILLGNVVRVAGVCRITDTAPTSSLALIEHGYLPIFAGDCLVPYASYAPVPVSTSEVINGIDAYVLAFQDPDIERAYSFDVIYIDRGSEDGLKPGDIFEMYKYGHAELSPSGETVETPDYPVSQLIILHTLQNTSSAMIISVATTDLVRIGDRIELIREQI